MTKLQRHICLQALIVVSGWFSLRYGWGIEVQRWPVLLTWGIFLSCGLVLMQGWMLRGKDTAKGARVSGELECPLISVTRKAKAAEEHNLDFEQRLGNLLAIIHRDGGHYIDEQGWDKAESDAIEKVFSWIQRDREAAVAENSSDEELESIAMKFYDPGVPDSRNKLLKELKRVRG